MSGDDAHPAQPTAWVIHPLANIFLPSHSFMPGYVADAIVDGNYEAGEAVALLDLVRPEARILELGGGLGFVSTLLCSRKPISRYVIVEADARLVPQIRMTHRRNGVSNVEVRWGLVTTASAAVAAKTQRFALPENFLGNSALLVDRGFPEVDVPTVSLQALLDELKPDTLIVDIEGAELGLFDDAELSAVRTLLVELHPDLIGEAGCARVIAAVERQGFTQSAVAAVDSVRAFQRAPVP